jgi:Flp pilus assembly pilin Flp
MKALTTFFARLFRMEEGQTLSEYALILFFVAIVTILALTALGVNITGVLNQIALAI